MGDFSSEYQSFRLLNLKHDDGGTYQCIAKNDVGSILSQKIEINIACKLIYLVKNTIMLLLYISTFIINKQVCV